MNRFPYVFFVLALMLTLNGCSHLKPSTLISNITGPDKLRVGVTDDAPPLAYRVNGKLSGLETKFANGLASATGRTLEFVELPRNGLTQALIDKKIDIIMAGLTTAWVEEQKLAGTNAYLSSGQVSLVHLNDYKRLGNDSRNLKARGVRIGVAAGTVGETFVNGLKSQGKTTRFNTAQEGVQALIDETIDVFVYDLPANFYYASLYIDKGLTPGVTPMTREEFVWGVRPDDKDMLKAADDYLASIKKSGELQAQIERSIPFYRNTAYSPKN